MLAPELSRLTHAKGGNLDSTHAPAGGAGDLGLSAPHVEAYLSECRQLTLREIRDLVPRGGRYRSILYDLMLDYPLREAKALRPALCVATCRALGGSLESVLRSAAIVELYHNAFLIHDDVEDGSESRRERPTLHWMHGAPIAVNVGDAMLALALEPLLDNMRLLGLGKALRIMQTIARMARESTEGQAIELHWIRSNEWRLTDADYIRMVYKKTSWYTFIAPMLIGGTVAGVAAERLNLLRKFAALLGIAFQIQDDILNLVAEGSAYGKEIAGDLWEGKHTLILMHALRAAGARDRVRAMEILRKPRPARGQPDGGGGSAPSAPSPLPALLAALEGRGELSAGARAQIESALDGWRDAGTGAVKCADDVQLLMTLIAQAGSIAYARTVAQRFARKAAGLLEQARWLSPSVHRDFLDGVVHFVISRGR